MRTDTTLRSEFGKAHNWQTKELIPVDDLSDVIPYLLQHQFVVEIEGHKYDISFGYNKKENYIGQSWSAAPSPHLMSYEMLNKAFKEGKWFIVKED